MKMNMFLFLLLVPSMFYGSSQNGVSVSSSSDAVNHGKNRKRTISDRDVSDKEQSENRINPILFKAIDHVERSQPIPLLDQAQVLLTNQTPVDGKKVVTIEELMNENSRLSKIIEESQQEKVQLSCAWEAAKKRLFAWGCQCYEAHQSSKAIINLVENERNILKQECEKLHKKCEKLHKKVDAYQLVMLLQAFQSAEKRS